MTADVTAGGVDMVTCVNNCFAVQVVGSISGANVRLAGKIQEATTATGTYVDVPGATFSTISMTSGIGGVQLISFQRNHRFVRYIGDMTGTTIVTGTTTTVLAIPLDLIIGGQKKEVS